MMKHGKSFLSQMRGGSLSSGGDVGHSWGVPGRQMPFNREGTKKGIPHKLCAMVAF